MLIALLVTAGADIDATNYSGETALMRASFSGENDVVRILVEAGGDNREDYQPHNILHMPPLQ